MTDLESGPPATRRGRHSSEPDADDDAFGVELASLESDDDSEPRGRHGSRHGGAGLSAAELIARARAETSIMPVITEPILDDGAAPTPTHGPDASTHERDASTEADVTAPAPTGVPTPVAKPVGRAGRNLPAAIGVGGGLGAVIVVSLFAYRPSFAVIVAIAAIVGVYEMVTAIETVEARPPLVPLLVGSAAMIAAAWFRGPDGLIGGLLLTVIGLVIWRLADGPTGYLADVGSSALIALYVPFLAGFAVLSVHAHDGAGRILLFVLTVVCSDTGGYAVGVLAGRTPMAPAISPKKSWEGFTGSMLTSCLAGALVMSLTFHEAWWKGVLFGAAVAVTATLGDLGESMIKRDLGLKDMGRLLPGHGGIMDRLDSLLPCAAVAYLLLAAFVGPAT